MDDLVVRQTACRLEICGYTAMTKPLSLRSHTGHPESCKVKKCCVDMSTWPKFWNIDWCVWRFLTLLPGWRRLEETSQPLEQIPWVLAYRQRPWREIWHRRLVTRGMRWHGLSMCSWRGRVPLPGRLMPAPSLTTMAGRRASSVCDHTRIEVPDELVAELPALAYLG